MERELLKLISECSQVYRVSVEVPFSTTTPPSPSTLNISGIHETSILQTPSRQDKIEETDVEDCKDTHPQMHQDKQTDEKDNDADNSKTTDTPQTPSSHSQQETNQTESMESDTKDTDTQGKEISPIVQVEKETNTLEDIIDRTLQYAPRPAERSESEAYMERLILAHLRLLINTRDELALTLACSMPGREITHQGFTDIRQEAQHKEMPMYQVGKGIGVHG